jgi:hypothetical protein
LPARCSIISRVRGWCIYRTKAPGAAILANLSGEIQVGFSTLLGVKPYLANGRLRGLAITAAKRSPSAPELPTVAETLPGYEVDQWYGVITSAQVSPAIVRKVHAGIVQALKSPEVIQRLGSDGSTTGRLDAGAVQCAYQGGNRKMAQACRRGEPQARIASKRAYCICI